MVGLTTPSHERIPCCGFSWERGRPARMDNGGPPARCGQACPRMGEAGDARAPRRVPSSVLSHSNVRTPGETPIHAMRRHSRTARSCRHRRFAPCRECDRRASGWPRSDLPSAPGRLRTLSRYSGACDFRLDAHVRALVVPTRPLKCRRALPQPVTVGLINGIMKCACTVCRRGDQAQPPRC